MKYVDYSFDIADNIIVFDDELTLKKLPTSWKEGDVWRMIIGANGQVTFIRETKAD